MSFKPLVFNSNLEEFHPKLLLLRNYMYLYKLSNFDPEVHKIIFPKLKRIKSLKKISINNSFSDANPEIRWFKNIFKSLNFFSSLQVRSIICLGKKMRKLILGSYAHDFRLAFRPENKHMLQMASVAAKKMTIDLRDCIDDDVYSLYGLSKIFKRAKIKQVYLNCSKFSALELQILSDQLKLNPNINIKLELSYEKLSWERLEILEKYKDRMEMNFMMDFSKFKFGMNEIMQTLRRFVLMVNFGLDPSQSVKLRILENCANMIDTSLILQFTWSKLSLSEVVDNIRLPSAIQKLKIIFMGCREDTTDLIENADEGNYAELLVSEKKEIRRFANHIASLPKLHAIGIHFRVNGIPTKFYHHFTNLVCLTAPDTLRKIKASIDKDENFRGKPDRTAFDFATAASILASKPKLIHVQLITKNPFISSIKKLINFSSLQTFVMPDLSFGPEEKFRQQHNDILRVLSRAPIEKIITTITPAFFDIYTESESFKKLHTIQCKSKNLTLSGESIYKFIVAIAMKKTIRVLTIPAQFQIENKLFEAVCDIVRNMRQISILSFGSNIQGLVKENPISELIVLNKSHSFFIPHVAEPDSEDFEDSDLDDDI